MTVTVRGDGIVFSDGTLQTRASTGTTNPGTPSTAGLVLGATELGSNWSPAVITTLTVSADSQMLGPGGKRQAWWDMTSQRAAGVTYTNTTGRGIMVAAVSPLSYDGVWINGYVQGNHAGGQGGDQRDSSNVNVTFVVPAGHNYRIDANLGVNNWMEFR